MTYVSSDDPNRFHSAAGRERKSDDRLDCVRKRNATGADG